MKAYSANINIMMGAVQKARRVLVRDFGEIENLQTSRKGPEDFVSKSYDKVEDILLRELQKSHPDYGFLSENSGEIEGENKEYRWIIEPIDGIINFTHGQPFFCVNIALEKCVDGEAPEIIAAVVCAPALREMFWAEKGGGAWLETEDCIRSRLRVSGRKKIEDSLLAVDSYANDVKKIGAVAEGFSDIRCFGSTTLSLIYVAAGRFDALIGHKFGYGDVAAGMFFVKEAGGALFDTKAKDKIMESQSLVAANADLSFQILKRL